MSDEKRVFRKIAPDGSILALNYAAEQDYSDNTLWTFYADYCKYTPAPIREYFFAVMVHGSPDSVAGVDGRGLFRIVNPYYNQYGFNRFGDAKAVLLLSCFAGIKIAPKFSELMTVPVIAGTSAVSQTSNGFWQTVRDKGDDVDTQKLTWVCCYNSIKKVIATTVLYPRAAIDGLKQVGWLQ